MFGFEVNTYEVSIQRKHIDSLLTNNPEVKKAIQDVISSEIWKARNRLAADIKNELHDSKGETWRSVRRVVYTEVFGGNLNIRNMKRGEAKWQIKPKTRKVEQNPHMRGGNRRKRSLSTARREGYEGTARGFILRFLNDGTTTRAIKYRRSGTGNRGRIVNRQFFSRLASQELQIAASEISRMIDQELEKVFNKNNT